jgi:hypothetical protein
MALSDQEELAVAALRQAWFQSKGDLAALSWYVVICAALALGAWLVAHAVLLVGAPHPVELCKTVAACSRYITSHPVPAPTHPLIPAFDPPK